MKFSRFAETIQLKNNNHVVSVTVTLKISDCNGIIYFTDMQLQDGDQLTGYTVHTSKMLTKMQENGQPVPPRHYNGVVRNSANRQVHLLTFSGTDSGALFSYRKNLKSIQRVVDTRELVTRLYAYGKDGMTFASINGGKEYVEDYTFSSEVKVSTLDCSSFTNPYQMLEYATHFPHP